MLEFSVLFIMLLEFSVLFITLLEFSVLFITYWNFQCYFNPRILLSSWRSIKYVCCLQYSRRVFIYKLKLWNLDFARCSLQVIVTNWRLFMVRYNGNSCQTTKMASHYLSSWESEASTMNSHQFIPVIHG